MKQSNDRYTIVVTGSIGTGKSAVTSIIRDMGYIVLDSDAIVHEGYESGCFLNESVVRQFGEGVRGFDGSIDRQALSKIVFKDDKALRELNTIVHTYVVKELISRAESAGSQPVFMDIPLMFEEKDQLEKMGFMYDEIWLVYVERSLQIKRLRDRALREGKDPQAVLKIADKQMDAADKMSMSDCVIDNSGTLDELTKLVKSLVTDKIKEKKLG